MKRRLLPVAVTTCLKSTTSPIGLKMSRSTMNFPTSFHCMLRLVTLLTPYFGLPPFRSPFKPLPLPTRAEPSVSALKSSNHSSITWRRASSRRISEKASECWGEVSCQECDLKLHQETCLNPRGRQTSDLFPLFFFKTSTIFTALPLFGIKDI